MMKDRNSIKALLLAALLAALIAGCAEMIYLTGHKTTPLQPYTGAPRTPIYHHGPWTIARASLHNHTTFSDGSYSPEDLLSLARQEGMAILSYNDHREGSICFRKGVCLPINGIERVGYPAYFERLNRVKAEAKDLIVLIGIEAIPYLYNAGKAPNFVIFGELSHFTVFGIADPAVYTNMPAIREMRDLRPQAPPPDLAPYQTFVDYLVERGGLVNCAHPESIQDDWIGPAHFINPGPVRFLHDLHHVNSFSILPEGYHEFAGGPGGNWDAALDEYLLGGRDQAPWALGDADYHQPEDSLARATTLFYLREFTEADVLLAMREGRMVALMGDLFQNSYVAEFTVSEGRAERDQILFGKTAFSGPPVIRFRLDHELSGIRGRLIRSGAVIHEFSGCSFEFTDRETGEKNLPAVYRVELIGPPYPPRSGEPQNLKPNNELFTNPIFFYPKAKKEIDDLRFTIDD